ncbi:MAG: putative zinc-binding metallopeptidase [Gammaproteobacteria bacterium]|nr:putative zinc-binding metallopeptidase [Gammaproteobacteria bacterium]
MKSFYCGNNQVFFENTRCIECERELGFVPELLDVCPLLITGRDTYRLADRPRMEDREFRKCVNYSRNHVCNWMVPVEDSNPFCQACRLNQMIPDLSRPENSNYWREIEQAKRRLLFTLLSLKLPITGRDQDLQYGLAFAFLADTTYGSSEFTDESNYGNPILTGHNQGLITINIAEADPGYREQIRQQMNESYRTLLGHFRHEVGHYYWYRLIFNSYWHSDFVRLFGDENTDYSASLDRYYREGPPEGWQNRYISAYATAHPWEDWAECWAHYMHIMDTLETAQSSRLLPRDGLLDNLSRRRDQSCCWPCRPCRSRIFSASGST